MRREGIARRYGITILLLAVFVLVVLFFAGVLTGQYNREYQNPYSRLMRIQGYRFGRPVDQIIPNEMSAYYERDIKGSKPNDIWVPSESSYALPPGLTEPNFINHKGEVPAVTFLEIGTELTFLKSLKNDRLRLAVIRSLYQRKGPATDKAAAEWNEQEEAKEKARVGCIIRWYELDRTDYSTSFDDWWRNNAQVFGLNADGDPLSSVAAQR
jgi:hypothetical protein